MYTNTLIMARGGNSYLIINLISEFEIIPHVWQTWKEICIYNIYIYIMYTGYKSQVKWLPSQSNHFL